MILKFCALSGRSGHEAGRELLAQAYREATGYDLPPIALTERGKPYFPDSPWHFSISHTKAIGIDGEETDRKINLALAGKILSPAEKVRYNAATDKRRALLTFWVLKEAAAKCSGEGLRGYPSHTDFSPDDPRVTEIDGCLVAIIEE